ncbi:hypothetical protein [Hymenobacter sp. 102]|uniref:hypothetical protein n=1 Tax=Hymenobacter sp. 102 TaxID=3403152 RepID=UPI003CFA3E6A
MFDVYSIDFGKVNWNWCHSLSILQEEMEELLSLPPTSWLYIKDAGAYEVVGYTKHRKFISVTFTLEDDQLVVEDVILPSYETIRDVIFRQFTAGNEPLDDR